MFGVEVGSPGQLVRDGNVCCSHSFIYEWEFLCSLGLQRSTEVYRGAKLKKKEEGDSHDVDEIWEGLGRGRKGWEGVRGIAQYGMKHECNFVI